MINPISNQFTANRRYTADKLLTWVEQSQDLMLRSTVSFLIVTYSGTFLSFNHLSNCIFHRPLLFLVIFALHAGYLFVTDTLLQTTELGVNEHHQNQVINYIRFARYQRAQRLRAVDACFEDVKDSRYRITFTERKTNLKIALCNNPKGKFILSPQEQHQVTSV